MMQAKHLQHLLLLLFSINVIFCDNKDSLKSLGIDITPHFPSLNVRELCNGLFFEARPLPGTDQFFIGCIKGEGVILQCDMNKMFDPNALRCVNGDDVPEATTSTTEKVTSTTPDYDSLCEGLNFNFINHPTDCGKLIFCFNGGAILRECPEDTIFDIDLEVCRSGNRETCEFYETTTTTLQTTTLPDLSGICDGLDRVFLEFPNDCRKAIFCFNGNAIVSQCRENTIFDVKMGDCRYGNSETCEFDDSTTTTAATTIPDYDALCEGLMFEFIKHPTNCAKAIFCYNEQAILRECPEETIFDLSTDSCRSGNRITCEFYPNIIIHPTHTDLSIEGLCKGHHFNYIKHPHECDKAIFCLHEQPILKECPLNNEFDVNSERCKESNKQGCKFSNEDLCKEHSDDFIAHETDSSRFYRCESGVTYLMTCDTNQVFDVNLEACRMKQIFFILFSVFAFYNKFAEAQINPCSGVWFGTVPHPTICYKYYTCLVFIPSEQTCGPNLIFDPVTLSCIPGNQETCEPYSETTTNQPISTTPEPDTTTQPISTTPEPDTTTQPISTTPDSTTTTETQTTTQTIPQSTTPGPDLPAICQGVFFAARPHPTSNFLFIGCIRGNGIVYQCLDNEEFDPAVNECVEICEVDENICVGNPGLVVLENKCDCATYVICYQERIIQIANCGPNQIFDGSIGDCRPGNPTTCEFTRKFF